MATTRTGNFPIGFRRLGSTWQADLDTLIAWARENDFPVVDLPPLAIDDLKRVVAAGLKIGTLDLKQPWGDLASADAGKRRAVVQANAQYIAEAAKLGARNYFTVAFPEDPARPRKETFEYAVAGYGALCESIAAAGARIVFEGYPGNDGTLACTPADYRALLGELPASAGVNFDPSHLLRMGINPVPFLEEFVHRIYHVHGKDTEMIDEALQDHGNWQSATFASRHRYGAYAWRYTLPGHGCARWTRMFQILKDGGYQGAVCIELEDENFNGTEEGEKLGFIASRDYLRYA